MDAYYLYTLELFPPIFSISRLLTIQVTVYRHFTP
jgi:hypothetical protein